MHSAIVTTGRFERPNVIILDEQLTQTFAAIRIIIEPLTTQPKRRKAGAFKGFIEVLPGFDDPLEDFKEYQQGRESRRGGIHHGNSTI